MHTNPPISKVYPFLPPIAGVRWGGEMRAGYNLPHIIRNRRITLNSWQHNHGLDNLYIELRFF